jgi:hypothetical protein
MDLEVGSGQGTGDLMVAAVVARHVPSNTSATTLTRLLTPPPSLPRLFFLIIF